MAYVCSLQVVNFQIKYCMHKIVGEKRKTKIIGYSKSSFPHWPNRQRMIDKAGQSEGCGNQTQGASDLTSAFIKSQEL